MNATPTLEGKIDALLAAQPQAGVPMVPQTPGMFAEPSQNSFGMPSVGSFLKVANANLLVITLGVILSSTFGGFISGMFPGLGRYATIAAGAVLILILRTGAGRDFASGVLIGGLAQAFSGIGASLSGMFGGGGQNNMGEFAEVRTTHGGTDGVSPRSPDRRVFR